MLKNILKKINIEIPFKKLCVYGIGNQFKEEYKVLKDRELILFDGNPEKWGRKVNKLIIHKPDDILNYFQQDTAVIIGCIYNQYEIAKSIIDKYDIPINCIYMYTSLWYESYVYQKALIEENWDRILNCYDKLADQESKEYYLKAINARKYRCPLFLCPNPKCKNIGEYGDVLILKHGEIIVDCGAYTGDTVAMYMERLNGECNIFAIEPFIESYQQMIERIKTNNWDQQVHPFNYALGSTKMNTELYYDKDDFTMTINTFQKIGNKSQKVLVDSLDHLLINEKVSYIKMDIEGKECLALEGARKLIQTYHPKLMISAYHRIEDFWELPEKIWDIDKKYNIYVGHAPNVSTELEFYCI